MSRRATHKLPSGELLDITITKSSLERLTMIVYPFIGGTTRLYEIPHHILTGHGISIIEFHPPSHGRSTGQMTMELGLQAFDEVLSDARPSRLIAVGHSAGANALLQYYNHHAIPIALYLVQPVFSFRESARYMYSNGRFLEILNAIKKWVVDEKRLENLLQDGSWLDSTVWQRNNLRAEIDQISIGIQLGEFLEDFYIRDHPCVDMLPHVSAVTTIYFTNCDNWYPPEVIKAAASASKIRSVHVSMAQDHFFRGGWPVVWTDILSMLTAQELA